MSKQDQKEETQEQEKEPRTSGEIPSPEDTDGSDGTGETEQRVNVSITHLNTGLTWKLGELTGSTAEHVCSMIEVNSQTGNAARFQVKSGEIVLIPGSVAANCAVTVERI